MRHPFFLLLLAISLSGCWWLDDDADAEPPPDPGPDPAICVEPTLASPVMPARPATSSIPPAMPAWSCDSSAGCAVTALDAGGSSFLVAGHSCARLADDRLVCWGSFPIEIADAPVLDVALGAWHGCALIAGGEVRCWGLDSANETGTRPAGAEGVLAVTTPAAVPDISGATALAAGGPRTCAIFADGHVQCWGDDEQGLLAAAAALEDVRDLAFGADHACALGGDGMVRCWGANDSGQLGLAGPEGNRLASDEPLLVAGLTGVSAIAAGESATCALLAGGTVSCWGYLGTGRVEGASGAGANVPCCPGSALANVCMRGPQAIPGLEDVTALALGKEHACALGGDGLVRCWGGNRAGQLGDDTFDPRAEPLAVPALTGATAVAVGRLHSCATAGDGRVYCWGDDEGAQLGTESSSEWTCTSIGGASYSCSSSPLPVAGFR